MSVKVRHALTDAIVHRDKAAVSLHARFDTARQKLRIPEEGPDQLGRQIDQRFIMLFWNQQTMPGKDRAMIQKGYAVVVFEDYARRDGAFRNPTEEACWVCHVRCSLRSVLHLEMHLTYLRTLWMEVKYDARNHTKPHEKET